MRIDVKKAKQEKLNNCGFSLIELVVVILMMGFISSMIVVFIDISKKQYEKVETDAKLQTEAEMATTYLSNVIMEAKSCSSAEFTYAKGEKPISDYEYIAIKAPDRESKDTHDYYYFFVIEKTSKVVYFGRLKDDTADTLTPVTGRPGILKSQSGIFVDDLGKIQGKDTITGMDLIGNPRKILAMYVKDMVVDTPVKESRKALLSMTIDFEYLGASYKSFRNIECRNWQ